MKDATGELSMTAIAVVAIAAIAYSVNLFGHQYKIIFKGILIVHKHMLVIVQQVHQHVHAIILMMLEQKLLV